MTDQLKLTYLVGQNDLSGRLNRPLVGQRKILDMFNFLVKKPTDLLFGRRLWTSVGSILVGMRQKRYNRPVEVCFWSAVLLFVSFSWSNWSVHCTILFTPKSTSQADQTQNKSFSRQPGRRLFPLVGAYKSVFPADQSLYIGG